MIQKQNGWSSLMLDTKVVKKTGWLPITVLTKMNEKIGVDDKHLNDIKKKMYIFKVIDKLSTLDTF